MDIITRWTSGFTGSASDIAAWELKYLARVVSGVATTSTPNVLIIENIPGYEVGVSGNNVTGIGADANITWTLKITIQKAR